MFVKLNLFYFLFEGGSSSDSLMKVNLQLTDAEKCKNSYIGLSNGINPETMICTHSIGKDTCQVKMKKKAHL